MYVVVAVVDVVVAVVVAVVDVVAAAVVDVVAVAAVAEVVEPEWTCATWTMAVAEVMVAVGRTGSSRATAGEVGLGTLASYRASCSCTFRPLSHTNCCPANSTHTHTHTHTHMLE